MERIQASERTREKLKALMAGKLEAGGSSSDPVRLAARLIVEDRSAKRIDLKGEAAP